MSKLLITILLSVAISANFFGQAITVNGVSLFESGGSPSNCSPGGYKTINAASTNGACLDLASAAFNAGAVWVCDGIDLNQTFKVSFTANFGTNQATGDGIAFLLQREALPQVIGGRGGGLGYAVGDGAGCQSAPCPIDPSVAVEFDTYNGFTWGDNDLPCNHMSIQIDGSTAASATIEGPNCLLPGEVSVVDGLDHDICITWDPGVLEYNVYFDGAQIGSFNGDIRTYFPNPTDVWWGFTAATGGAAQDQFVCNVVMETNINSPSCICNPTISTATNSFPSTCNGSDGSFLIGSLEPNSTYDFSYDLDGFTIGPFAITTDAFGNYLLSGLGAGTYTNFTADLLGCIVVSAGPLLLIEPDPPILVITDPPARCEPGSIDLTDPSITDGSSGGGTLTYWVDASATILVPDPSSVTTSGTYYIQADNGCTDTQPVNVIVDPAPMVNSPLPWEAIICSGGSISFTPSADIPGTTFSWFATPSSPILSGFSPNGNSSINESISNVGNATETVIYTISSTGPAPSFCTGSSFDYIVTVSPSPNLGTESYVGCAGDGYSVAVNGVTYDESNPSGSQVISNANGCDSTVTIDLTFNSSVTGSESYLGCAGDGYSVVVNGVTYDESNPSGTETLTAVAGCDSIVTIDLVYNNNTTGTESYIGCEGDGYSVAVNGVTYDESNPSGTQVFSNANGCDSTVTIDLVYNNNTTGTESYVGCAGDGYSLVVNGVTYDESNPSGTQVLSNANGCDSTVTIDLVYNNNTIGTESYVGCAGDGYSVAVNGVTYDESNPSGSQVISNANGCDSTVTIDLTFNSSVTGSESYLGCAGDGYSVVVNGVTYDEGNPSGTETLTAVAGCDSIVTIDLVYNNNTTGTESYIGCEGDGYSVAVNGVTYDESNPSGTQVLSNANGCDSTVTIDLVYNNNTTGTESYVGCAGDGYSVVVNGVTYDESNPSGTQVLSNANGCDSSVTIDLVYNNNTTGTESYVGCAGDGYSVAVNGVTYDESNPSGSQVISNANGCDSTVTIDLTFNSSVTGSESYLGCAGDGYSVVVNGVTYDESNPSGTETLTAVAGCDSIVTIDLVYNNNTTGTESYIGCEGDGYSVAVNGVTYDESNPSGTQVLSNANGCDSTVTIDLVYNNNTTGTESYVGCAGDGYSLVVNGVTYDESNPSGTQVLSNANGCDSSVTIDLVYNNNTTGTESYVGCAGDGYSVAVNGVTYDESNPSGSQVISNANGCDSTVTIDLTFNSSVTGSESYLGCAGDGYSVVVNGVTYDEGNPSGTETLTALAGCDSIVTIDLVYNSNTIGTESYVGCAGDGYSVVVNGVTYDESNPSGTQVISNANGCDSTVTIDLVYNNITTGTESYVGCAGDGYSVVVNGVTYDESNPSGTQVLSNANGCDSTVTIDLVYNNITTGTESYVGCAGDGYSVAVNGVTYDESNPSGMQVLSNANGCDSTVTIDLVYNNNTTGTESYVGCAGDGYSVAVNGVTYDESNPSGTQVLSNANGCDSTVSIDLVYDALPSFSISGTDPSVCNANDGSITIGGLNPSTEYTLGYDSLSVASQIITITTDASGEYIISGLLAGLYDDFNIELNSCSFTLTQTVDLNNPGAPSIDAISSTTACDTYILPAITGTNLSGNQSYYTQSNGAGTPVSEGDVVSSTQTIYIYDILGSCSDESNFTITIDYTPSLINPGPQEACEFFDLPLGIDGSNLSGNENYYSNLQSNGGTVITDAITSSQTVYIYDANGNCSNEIAFEVTVNPLPSLVSFTGEGTYCEGDDVNNLIVEVSGGPDYTLNYTLNGNPTTISSSNSSIDLGNDSGTYVLTALADNACVISLDQTQTITMNPLPSIPTVSEDASYCSNTVAEDLQASGGSGNYSWYSDVSLSELIGSNQSYAPNMIMGTTTYYVTAIENGCEGLPAVVSITFENCEIIIPTAFTPDDDQVNDKWNLGNIDVIYPNNVVSVYNRWGNKVYESDKGAYSQRPWNGTFNQEALPVASYYFIIEFNDNSSQNKTGIVSIIK